MVKTHAGESLPADVRGLDDLRSRAAQNRSEIVHDDNADQFRPPAREKVKNAMTQHGRRSLMAMPVMSTHSSPLGDRAVGVAPDGVMPVGRIAARMHNTLLVDLDA